MHLKRRRKAILKKNAKLEERHDALLKKGWTIRIAKKDVLKVLHGQGAKNEALRQRYREKMIATMGKTPAQVIAESASEAKAKMRAKAELAAEQREMTGLQEREANGGKTNKQLNDRKKRKEKRERRAAKANPYSVSALQQAQQAAQREAQVMEAAMEQVP